MYKQQILRNTSKCFKIDNRKKFVPEKNFSSLLGCYRVTFANNIARYKTKEALSVRILNYKPLKTHVLNVRNRKLHS